MTPQQLALPGMTEQPEAGLTDWRDGPPPMVGWWETRLRGSTLIITRRFWRGGPRVPNSAEVGFSRWSYPAENRTPSFQLYLARTSPSYIDEDLVQWRGLLEPLPAGNYPFKLELDRYVRQRMWVPAHLLRVRARLVET